MFDVLVIGGGVIGALTLRELTKYKLSVVLVEKENDVCMGQSKANSGIVHAGYDAKPGSLKAKFNVLGNAMMKEVAFELGVKYKNCGSLVVAYSKSEIEILNQLKKRGETNGVCDLEILNEDELKKIEPNLSNNAVGALFAKSGGIVCPYELTIASIGNAMDNGAKLKTNFNVVKIERQGDYFNVFSENGETLSAKVIVNASGLNGEKTASLIGDVSFKIGGRKGEYLLLDKESGNFVNHTVFKTPTELGKGILATQTVDGNLMLGPTAEVVDDDIAKTSNHGLNFIIKTAGEMLNNPPIFNTITSFAGIRAFSDRHDFIIEQSNVDKRFINVVGIESPGLTSAPAIAKYVVENLISNELKLIVNENFNPRRKADYFFKNLTQREKNEIIKKDKSYGKIVCRCEQITEGEIVRAIHENPKARDLDGIKRRVRAGMGRCQGGFCQPQILQILARELKVPVEQVTKKGENSQIIIGKTK